MCIVGSRVGASRYSEEVASSRINNAIHFGNKFSDEYSGCCRAFVSFVWIRLNNLSLLQLKYFVKYNKECLSFVVICSVTRVFLTFVKQTI